MSEYSSLKATINANVKTNNNQEITGAIMNSVLNAMVSSLGAGYQYMGVASPTNPGTAQTPDYKCFYLATSPGTYTYLGGLVVADGEVALLKYDSSWTKEVTGIATADQLNQLEQNVTNINIDLNGNGGSIPYFLQKGKRFLDDGYVNSGSYCCSQIFPAGTYSIPAVNATFRYYVTEYISDSEGNILISNRQVALDATYANPVIITFKRADLASLTETDYEYLSGLSVTKTKSDLSLNEIREEISGYGNTDGSEIIIEQTIQEDANFALDWASINISKPLTTKDFIVSLDKVAGHHNKYSIRLYRTQYNPRNIVIYENCIMGVEYTIKNANIADYPYLYIRESGDSSWQAVTNSYKLKVKTIPQDTTIGKFTRTMGFINRKILMLGDSLTQLPRTGTRTYGDGIVEFFARKTGAIVIRGGIGGSHISSRMDVSSLATITDATEAAAVFDMVNLVRAITTNTYTLQDAALTYMDTYVTTILADIKAIDFSKLDIITIFAGTNDFNSSSVVAGNEDSFDEVNNLRGALNSILKMICTAFPHIKVYVFTPTVRWWAGEAADWSNTALWCENYQKSGRYLKDFADAIINGAKYNQTPVCDLYREMGWNVYNYHNFCNLNDGTHPYKGFEQIADKMASYIMANQ